jgi:hypothetical protein
MSAHHPGRYRVRRDVHPVRLARRGRQQVIDRIEHAQTIAGTSAHAELIAACLERLSVFRLSRRIAALDRILARLAEEESD